MKKTTSPQDKKKDGEGSPRLLSPASAHAQVKRLLDDDLINAVFSGGYYIVYSDDDWLSFTDIGSRAQQERKRKKETTQQMCSVARQLIENTRQLSDRREGDSRHHQALSRHEMLLEELQFLITKSNLLPNAHAKHLRDEINIARSQLLRGGGIDEYDIMKTLQEIASLQGLAVGGAVAGRFVADIINPAEPGTEAPAAIAVHTITPQAETPAQQLPHCEEADRDSHFFQPLDYFHAYDIAEIGGCKHKHSHFFARHLKKNLLESDKARKQAQDANEIVP